MMRFYLDQFRTPWEDHRRRNPRSSFDLNKIGNGPAFGFASESRVRRWSHTGAFPRKLRGNFFCFSKHCQVDVTVRILFKHGAAKRVGPHRTTTMTKREVITLNTILWNDRSWPLKKFLPGATLLQHHPEIVTLKNVAEKIFRIACYPAVALGNEASRVDRNKLIGTVGLPNARQTAAAVGKLLDQLIDWSNRDALAVSSF